MTEYENRLPKRPDVAPNWPRSRYKSWTKVVEAIKAPLPSDPVEAMVRETQLLMEWVRHAPGLWERVVADYEDPNVEGAMSGELRMELQALSYFYFAVAGREVMTPASLIASNVMGWINGRAPDLYAADFEDILRIMAKKSLRFAAERAGPHGAN